MAKRGMSVSELAGQIALRNTPIAKVKRRDRPYWLLLTQDDQPNRPWQIAFGDPDKAIVEAEREDYRDGGWKAKRLRVLKAASMRQSDCDAAVRTLNAKEGW